MTSPKCPECGGDCVPGDCGIHPAGCVYGGFSCGYWLIAKDCPFEHPMFHCHTKDEPCPEQQ